MTRTNPRIAGAKWPPWRSQSARWPEIPATVHLTEDDLRSRRADRWPLPPQHLLRYLVPEKALAIDIEVVVDEGRPYVTGYSVRTTVATDKNGSPEVKVEDDRAVMSGPWKLGSSFRPVSLRARDMRQLKLADFAAAARAQAADPLGTEGAARAVRALKRKPPRDRGTGFYDHLLEWNKVAGPTEIARELGEDPGLVRVWLYRAKQRADKRKKQAEIAKKTRGRTSK